MMSQSKNKFLMPVCDFENKPPKVTNEYIRALGEKYLQAFGEKETFRHKSHRFARQLKEYQGNDTSEARWHFLIGIYKQLASNEGELARDIRDTFQKAFNKVFLTQMTHSGMMGPTTFYYKTSEIAERFLSCVNAYYLDFYRAQTKGLLEENKNLKGQLKTLQSENEVSSTKTPTLFRSSR